MRQPSAIHRQRYVLYFRGHRAPDEYPRIWVPIYEDPSRAKALLLKYISSQDYSRDGNVLTFGNGFTATSEQLQDILDAPHTDWQVPEADARSCLRFRLGSWDERPPEPTALPSPDPDPDGPEPVLIDKPKPGRPPKEKKAVKPDGYVTIGELCLQWNIKPLDARTALRGSGKVKPNYGWSFAPKDIPSIAKLCGVKLK